MEAGRKTGVEESHIGFGPDPYTSPIDLTRRREASHGGRVYHVVGLNYLRYAEDLYVPADFISAEEASSRSTTDRERGD